MKRMMTKLLGGASVAGFVAAATFALAPAAHAEAGPFADGSVRHIRDTVDLISI
jgi:hypothetical protein